MKVNKVFRFAILGIAAIAMLLPVTQFFNLLNQPPATGVMEADGAPFPPIPPRACQDFHVPV